MAILGVEEVPCVVTEEVLHGIDEGVIRTEAWLSWIGDTHREVQRKSFRKATVRKLGNWLFENRRPGINSFFHLLLCGIMHVLVPTNLHSRAGTQSPAIGLDGMHFFCDLLPEASAHLFVAGAFHIEVEWRARSVDELRQPGNRETVGFVCFHVRVPLLTLHRVAFVIMQQCMEEIAEGLGNGSAQIASPCRSQGLRNFTIVLSFLQPLDESMLIHGAVREGFVGILEIQIFGDGVFFGENLINFMIGHAFAG